MVITDIKEFYDKIEIGKFYESEIFWGFADLLTIDKEDKDVEGAKNIARSKKWTWFLFEYDPFSHPFHKKLIILDKECNS